MPKVFSSRHSDLSRCRIPASQGMETPPAAGPLLAEAFEAALLLVDFFPASGVPHPPEAAGGVDWQAGLGFGRDREN